MDAKILEHLRKEEAELVCKLDAIRTVILVYERRPSATPRQRAEVSDHGERPLARAGSEYAASIRKIARETIENSSTLPVPTREIVAKVRERGVEIRGQNELNAVSALLSRSDEFQSQGRTGWVLADFVQRYGAPPSGGADENEAPNGRATGASETGEAATSPIEKRDEFNELLA